MKLLQCALLIALMTQQPPSASIEGVVIDSGTRAPIEDAQLTLRLPNGGLNDAGQLPKPAIAVSDADGKFSFRGLKPDTYRLEIAVNGYAQQNYGQKTFPGAGTNIEVAPDQAVKGLTIAMTPTGTVSGRLQDDGTGRPVASVPVRLLRFSYTPEGERELQEAFATKTNDRGEYRLFHVTPARYYLSAGGPAPRNRGDDFLPIEEANEVPVIYGTRYYPGVAGTREAVVLDVKPGAELPSHDLRVSAQGLYRIRGRILDAKTGQPFQSPNASIALARRSDNKWTYVRLSSTNYRRADGSFELRDLEPGTYTIVTTMFPGGTSRTGFGPARTATSLAQTEIVAADVEGLTILVPAGVLFDGKIRVDGQAALPAFDMSDVPRIELIGSDGLLQSYGRLIAPPAAGEVRFDNVAPAEYRVIGYGLPEGYYIKEASIAGFDALHGFARIPDQEKATLEIVISPKVASVKGVVTTDRQQPAADVRVVLIPERERNRWELVRTGQSDANGAFSFSNVVPGAYRIYAWEAIENGAYFDLEVLKQAEGKGKSIQLSESSAQNVTLTMIPVAK